MPGSKKKKPSPSSCDTFVAVGLPIQCVLDRSSPQNITVFGKNSDRPKDEQHEVVFFPRKNCEENTKVKCQYISIPQVTTTYSTILSRPTWLWGCEMGSNEYGLCAGNEAVWTREEDKCDDGVQRLIGMDLVRLVLERAKTSREAVEICSSLLEEFGQGGGCAEDDSSWCYENGFLFADMEEAWVFETAGKSWWAAERVEAGTLRNISNGLSIRKPDLMHSQLEEYCQAKGWLKTGIPSSQRVFDWKSIMTHSSEKEGELEPSGREKVGLELLRKNFGDYCENEKQCGIKQRQLNTTFVNFSFNGMVNVLRNEEICMQGEFQTTGSQISVLSSTHTNPSNENQNNVHFFSSYNPDISIYKPFIFPSTEQKFGKESFMVSLMTLNKKTHALWSKYHKMRRRDRKSVKEQLLEKEKEFLSVAEKSLSNVQLKVESKNIFEECIDQEIAVIQC